MTRRRANCIFADGITWDRGEWERARKLAVAICRPDVRLIDELVRHCQHARRRGRPDMIYGQNAEKRYRQLVRDLYEWVGEAAVAHDDPQTVPLTLAEVKHVERLREQIQYFTGYYMRDRDPLLDQADDLLNRLHFLAGNAKATGNRGGAPCSAQTASPKHGGSGRHEGNLPPASLLPRATRTSSGFSSCEATSPAVSGIHVRPVSGGRTG
jgi:hypothetical protein